MKTFKVKVTVRKMGRSCQTCSQQASGLYQAESAEHAIQQAKAKLNVDLGTHQVLINYVREV